MAAINTQQIRKIYAIGNALGIVERGNEDDDLHALVSALTGKDSVKSLTYAEAQAVITDLQKRQGEAPLPRHKPKTHPERPGGATDGQQRKVWALMYQLAKEDKELRIDSTPQQPFIWLDFQACNKLIEVLKGYVNNAKRGGDHG